MAAKNRTSDKGVEQTMEKPIESVEFEREDKVNLSSGGVIPKRKFKFNPYSDTTTDFSDIQGGDPEYYYDFIRRTPDNLSQKRFEGYEVVDNAEKEGIKIQSPDGKMVDACITVGDLIVAKIPRELRDAKDRQAHDKAQVLQKISKERFKHDTGKYGFVEDDNRE